MHNIPSPPLKQVLEAALLTSATPLSIDELRQLFVERVERATIRMLLDELRAEWEQPNKNTLELVQVASGYRFQAREVYLPYIARLNPERPQRYSRAAMETLAIIAYRQPVTRGDIEQIRGVAVNPNIIRQFVEREWIDIVGQREVPGRPALYATTQHFLDDFNLQSLADLPPMQQFTEAQVAPAAETQSIETMHDVAPSGVK